MKYLVALFLIATASICSAQNVSDGEFRHWTAGDGKKSSVRLKVVEYDENTVRLRREDNGELIALPISRLMRADQEYLRRMASHVKQTDSSTRGATRLSVDRPTFDASVRPVLQEFCVRCHGPDEQEAGLRLDTVTLDFAKRSVAMSWPDAASQIRAVLSGLDVAMRVPSGE